jgi:phosphoribosyl-dephospho-CoA transferase
MPLDSDKINQAVLALLSLGKHEGCRAWKSFDGSRRNCLLCDRASPIFIRAPTSVEGHRDHE